MNLRLKETTMKTKASRLVTGLTIALASPIAIACLAPKVNAQISVVFQAAPGLRLCQTIDELSKANNHPELQMAARECFFLLQEVGGCRQLAALQSQTGDQCWQAFVDLTPRIRAVGRQLNR